MSVHRDAGTKEARHRAHEVLSKSCREFGVSMDIAYGIVRLELRMIREEAHMGRFSKEQCEALIGKL